MKWSPLSIRPARRLGAVAGLAALVLLGVGVARAQTVFTWSGGDIVTGTITPSSVTTVTPTDTLNINTGADHDFNGTAVTNNGTVDWNAGNLRSGNGGVMTNNATWNDAVGNSQINNAYGGTGGTTFVNSATGTYNKLSGTTDFTIGFTNAGIINVTGGSLNLDAGGSFADGSVVGSSGGGVLQLTQGTLSMTGNITATNFLFNGGTLAGNQTFVNSTLNWQNGDFNSANTTTLAATTTLNLVSGNDHNFNQHTIVNNGTVNWTNGNLRSGNGGLITNNATWNDTVVNNQINNAYGGTGGTTFVNAAGGVYNKISGTTDFTIGFTNAGIINVTGGSLNLDAGGSFADGSVVGSSGGGVLQLTQGTLTMTGNITATNFLFNGGTLAGDQTFVNSTLTWQNGDFNSANTTTLAASTTLDLVSGSDHNFNQHTIVNNGTINWTNGNIRSGNGGIITNNGVWNDTVANNQINDAYGGTGGTTFVNAAGGIYSKTTGITDFEIGLTNYGTVLVSGGTLNLDAGGTFYNGSAIGSTGTGVVQLTGGTLTGAGGGFTATNFLLTGGTITGDITFLGTTNWVGSNFNNPTGTATIGATGVLNITSGADHNFNQHAIVNNGTVNWSDGNIRAGNGAVFTNNSVWNDTATNNQINDAYGGTGGTTFVNAVGAIYNKTAGTTLLANNVLVNNGTISVSGGVLNLDGGILNDGSTIGSSGTGAVQLVSGGLTANGTINVQNLVLSGGQLAGAQTFSGTLTWLGTDLNTTGTTVISSGSALTIDNGNDHNFNQHTIVNNGTVSWLNGNIRSGNAGSVTNNGVWNDSVANNQINDAYGGTGGTTFLNTGSGVYNKTAGTTLLANGVLVNDGTVNVSGGTLSLDGGTLDNGSSIGSTGTGVVQLVSGSLNVNGVVQTQNLLLAGGQLNGNQIFNGTLSWLSTDLSTIGITGVGPAGTFTIDSGNDHNFNQHTIVNAGTVDWNNGNLRSGNGGTITNYGVWNDAAPNNQINNAYGGAGGTTFTNAVGSVYNKTGGTTSFQVPLVNLGTINIVAGTLALASGYSDAAGTVSVATGATFSSASPLAFSTGSLLTGDGLVSASTLTVSGAIKPGSSLAAGQLTLTGNVTLLAPAFTDFVIGGTAQGTQYDFLIVNGNLVLGGNLQIGFANGFDSTINGSMTFDVATSNALSGSFLDVANGARLSTADGLGSFVVNYGAGSPFGVNDVVLSSFVPVPEPSTWALLLGGTGLLALAFRRRRQA